MRIALVTESFFPAVDSATTTVKAVADRLVDRGDQVLLVAPGPGLSSYRGCRIARVTAFDRPGRQVREALEAFGPDVAHITSPGAVGRKALKHADRLGVPTVLVEQSPRPSGLAADRRLVTSRWLLDDRARLWEPGVDRDAFTPALRDTWLHERWSRSRTRPVPLVLVGYVGGLRNRHDVRRLAELAVVPGIRPVIVGDGPQRDWLAARLPSAKLTGPLATGDLATVVPTLDLLVHPGTRETCCHALREAAAAGVPVVAPRAGGAVDVVRHLETGVLYDPEVPHALAHAVASVAADRRRALLGDRGRELATRSWPEAVDELVARHYSPLVGATRLPTGNRT